LTKKEIIEIDKSKEIMLILENTVSVYQKDVDRAEQLKQKYQTKLSYAIVRRDTYQKTGKLLPAEEAK
jgi:hypothetical protein